MASMREFPDFGGGASTVITVEQSIRTVNIFMGYGGQCMVWQGNPESALEVAAEIRRVAESIIKERKPNA